jgi:hypothetical protein
MRYFPEDKAAVSGVLKAYLGLSSAVFQQVYATFVPFRPERDAGSSRENDASDRAARFVLLVAVVGGAAAVIGAPFFLVREEAFEHREEAFERGDGSDGTENARIDDGSKTGKKTRTELARTALSRLNRLVVALAIFVSVAAAANDPSVVGVPAPPLWVNGAFTLVIITLLIAPFASFAAIGAFGTAKEETRRERSRETFGPTDADVGSTSLSDPLLSFPRSAVRSADDSADEEGRSSEGPLFVGARRVDLDLLEAFKTPEQWLLFATISSSSGAAMALVNNLDQVSAAAGSAPAVASALVSAFSVCNCLGRLIGGELSELVFRKFGVSRVTCLGAAQVAVAFGLAVAAFFPTPLGVFVAVAAVGGALGAHWGALPALAAELFGAAHVGAVYGWLCVSPMLGSYVLSTRVFGDWYDDALAKQTSGGSDSAGGEKTQPCLGGECFRGAFLVGAACAFASAAVTCVLAVRCARVYARLRGKLAAAEARS